MVQLLQKFHIDKRIAKREYCSVKIIDIFRKKTSLILLCRIFKNLMFLDKNFLMYSYATNPDEEISLNFNHIQKLQ